MDSKEPGLLIDGKVISFDGCAIIACEKKTLAEALAFIAYHFQKDEMWFTEQELKDGFNKVITRWQGLEANTKVIERNRPHE